MSNVTFSAGNQSEMSSMKQKQSKWHIYKTAAFTFLVIVIVCYFPQSGCSTIDFGNILRQPTGPVGMADTQVQAVLKFTQKYAEKRSPWSVPVSTGKGYSSPEVLAISKTNLVYSHDNMLPLYYNDEVVDRYGNHHGITSFIVFGSTYRLSLAWSRDKLTYTHNFTISLYPAENINIYSHTFFVQSVNKTTKANKYLFPIFDKVKATISLQKQFSYFDQNLEIHSVNEELVGQSTRLATDDEVSKSEHCSQDHCEGHDNKDSGDWKYSKYKAGQFSVMCYNIWNMNTKSTKSDGYTNRMTHLKETIEKADPDIVGLQEVRYEEGKGETLGPNQIHMLSEWLPQYQYVYQPAQMHPTALEHGRVEEGVAIMSKYPIVSHDYLLLFINRSNSADLHQRILLHTVIAIPLVGKVHVFNTHLSLSHEAREQSVVQIWKHVQQFEGPVIVIGDFNAEPQEPAVKYITGQLEFPGAHRSHLVDVWREANPSKAEKEGHTFTSLKKLNKRIDYILYRGWEGCCKIQRCDVLDDGTRGVKAASDHLPLLAVFSTDMSP